MSRSDHYMGLSPRGRLLANMGQKVGKREHEGTWNAFPLWTYMMPNGKLLEEVVQDSPWRSGPYWFLTLREVETGRVVQKSSWRRQEIANAMGIEYKSAQPEPSPEQLESWQALINWGLIVIGDSEKSRVHLDWSSQLMFDRAVASGKLTPPQAEDAASES